MVKKVSIGDVVASNMNQIIRSQEHRTFFKKASKCCECVGKCKKECPCLSKCAEDCSSCSDPMHVKEAEISILFDLMNKVAEIQETLGLTTSATATSKSMGIMTRELAKIAQMDSNDMRAYDVLEPYGEPTGQVYSDLESELDELERDAGAQEELERATFAPNSYKIEREIAKKNPKEDTITALTEFDPSSTRVPTGFSDVPGDEPLPNFEELDYIPPHVEMENPEDQFTKKLNEAGISYGIQGVDSLDDFIAPYETPKDAFSKFNNVISKMAQTYMDPSAEKALFDTSSAEDDELEEEIRDESEEDFLDRNLMHPIDNENLEGFEQEVADAGSKMLSFEKRLRELSDTDELMNPDEIWREQNRELNELKRHLWKITEEKERLTYGVGRYPGEKEEVENEVKYFENKISELEDEINSTLETLKEDRKVYREFTDKSSTLEDMTDNLNFYQEHGTTALPPGWSHQPVDSVPTNGLTKEHKPRLKAKYHGFNTDEALDHSVRSGPDSWTKLKDLSPEELADFEENATGANEYTDIDPDELSESYFDTEGDELSPESKMISDVASKQRNQAIDLDDDIDEESYKDYQFWHNDENQAKDGWLSESKKSPLAKELDSERKARKHEQDDRSGTLRDYIRHLDPDSTPAERSFKVKKDMWYDKKDKSVGADHWREPSPAPVKKIKPKDSLKADDNWASDLDRELETGNFLESPEAWEDEK